MLSELYVCRSRTMVLKSVTLYNYSESDTNNIPSGILGKHPMVSDAQSARSMTLLALTMYSSYYIPVYVKQNLQIFT